MLLSDFIQARREKRIEAAKIAKVAAKEEGRAKGRAEGIVEGIAKGRAEGEAKAYRKWTEWDRRRKEAEARGEAFTEPPLTQPKDLTTRGVHKEISE